MDASIGDPIVGHQPTAAPAVASLCFREAANVDELEALFRLRYRVYREPPAAGFEPRNPVGFNVDPWDRLSSHFGLFDESIPGSDRPIGHLRVVEGHERPTNHMVVELARRHRGAGSPFATARFGYPSLGYWPEPAGLGACLRWSTQRGGLVEASRLSVEPGAPRITAGLLVHASMAVYLYARRVAAAVLSCSAAHGRVYGRLGFRRIPGTTDTSIPRVLAGKTPCSIRLAHRWTVPTTLRPRLAAMAAEYRANGTIRHRPVAVRACA